MERGRVDSPAPRQFLRYQARAILLRRVKLGRATAIANTARMWSPVAILWLKSLPMEIPGMAQDSKLMLELVRPIIADLRRGVDTEKNWTAFRLLIENNIDDVCRELNTRWLVSVCDTYVDFGEAVERRNAMIIATLANMEKVSQSYLMWRVNYDDAFNVPPKHKPRKMRLWDGMFSMRMYGDVTNNLFRLMHVLLESTPHLYAIFKTILHRISVNDTILAAMNKRHGHVFEPDLIWRDAPEYDQLRARGLLPPLSRPRGSND